MFDWGLALGGIGSLAGAVGSWFGAKKEASSAEEINRQNIAQSQQQMRWQEEMSNTQYQRAAKDLEKAGLNRILALGGPAHVGQYSLPQLTNPYAGYTEKVANSAQKASEIIGKIPTLKMLNAQAQSAESQAKVDKQQADLTTSDLGRRMMILKELAPLISGVGNLVFSTAKGVTAWKAAQAIKNVKIFNKINQPLTGMDDMKRKIAIKKLGW